MKYSPDQLTQSPLKVITDFISSNDGLKAQFDDFMPRHISPPGGYIAPRHWWSACFAAIHPDIVVADGLYPKDLRICVANAVSMMRGLNGPTYFPSKELIEALDNTDINDIDFRDIKFPADAMMFMLPNEPQYMKYDMDYGGQNMSVYPVCVSLSRFQSPLRTDDGSTSSLKERPVLEGTMLDSKGDIGWVRIPCEGAWSDTMKRYGSDMVYDRMGMRVDPKENPVVEKDSAQTQWAFRMAVKLLIAMNTIGDLHIPEPKLARAANIKKGRREMWQGQVMTLARAVSSEAGGSHASPRFHLRRGHIRQQRHGVANQLTKVMWIKPTWVGKLGGA